MLDEELNSLRYITEDDVTLHVIEDLARFPEEICSWARKHNATIVTYEYMPWDFEQKVARCLTDAILLRTNRRWVSNGKKYYSEGELVDLNSPTFRGWTLKNADALGDKFSEIIRRI